MPAPAVSRVQKAPSRAAVAPPPPQPVAAAAAAAPYAAAPRAYAAPVAPAPLPPPAAPLPPPAAPLPPQAAPLPPPAYVCVAAPQPPPAPPAPLIMEAATPEMHPEKVTEYTERMPSKPFGESQIYMLSQHDEPSAFGVFNIFCNLFMGACIGATAVLLAMYFFSDCRFIVSVQNVTHKPKSSSAATKADDNARAGHEDMGVTSALHPSTDEADLSTGDGTTNFKARWSPPSEKKTQKSSTRKEATQSRKHGTPSAAKGMT